MCISLHAGGMQMVRRRGPSLGQAYLARSQSDVLDKFNSISMYIMDDAIHICWPIHTLFISVEIIV